MFSIFSSEKLRRATKRIFIISVPAILVAVVTFYVFNQQTAQVNSKGLPGRPLASYEDIYPVRADANNALFLDKERFVKAVHALTNRASPRAIADLIYLGNANHVQLWLDVETRRLYEDLSTQPSFSILADVNRQRDQLLQPYKDIVNGIGATFAGTPIEIVLHDTRDPMHSIVAVQNTITGRKIGDTNTNFGVQLIKSYSATNSTANPFVSYELHTKDGRRVKSSTVPIFNSVYGLIGFICINIDLSKIDAKNKDAFDKFIENFRMVTPNDVIDEMIENAKVKK